MHMLNNYFKKYFAVVLISLFIGFTFSPIINANSVSMQSKKVSEINSLVIIKDNINKNQRDQVYETSLYFSSPKTTKRGSNIKISLQEETSQTLKPNQPMLPVVTKVYILPFKSKIKDLNIYFGEVKEKKLLEPLCLAPEPIPIGQIDIKKQQIKNQQSNLEIYPKDHYNYYLNSGRYNDEIVNYLTLKIYPVQYEPINKKIIYYNKVDIILRYEMPDKPSNFGDEYDLLIITPTIFSKELKPLVEHKENYGIRTKLVTLNEILWGISYPKEGRDRAEKLKYFIKYALEQWGIKYVLLVGGRKGGVLNPIWWVPARYSNIVDFIEYSFLSDLYFADVYDSEGNFSSWDSNNDNIFAEWRAGKKDIIDMYPEVNVGRLPCKNKEELIILVDKIIDYETNTFGEEWFNRYIGVAGDTYPNNNEPYYEGELSTQASFDYLEGYKSVFLWTSTGSFSSEQDIISHVNEGCGFLMFSGHSNAFIWSTHPPENNTWVDAPNCFNMDVFKNINRYPIVHVSGCWNTRFDSGILVMINGILREGHRYFIKTSPPSGYFSYEWVPQCWSWSLCGIQDKGCIAITGNTGLGYGINGEDCLSGKSNFIELQFFKSYSEGMDILGEVHSNQIIKYMSEFPPMEDKIDCKLAQERTLLGDPSLKIGGYPPKL